MFVAQQLGEPNRDLVLCRCFSLLGSPLNSNRGPSILCFLQHFSPYVSVYIADLWAHKLPQLINYLQGMVKNETNYFNFYLKKKKSCLNRYPQFQNGVKLNGIHCFWK